jgi:hypothetical protein
MQKSRPKFKHWVATGVVVGAVVGMGVPTAMGVSADGIFPWIIGGAFAGALIGTGALKRRP